LYLYWYIISKLLSQYFSLNVLFLINLSHFFQNSAITGLSAHGQRVLQEEEHKFGQLLLRMEQRRLGPGAGAQRYMEILQLLGTAIGQARRIRDITIYMDNVHDRGKLQNEFLIEMPSFHPLFD
jgi:hypothetical protein